MRPIQPHALHRVAFAVADLAAAEQWLTRVVGSTPIGRHNRSEGAEIVGNLVGTDMAIVWSCGHPLVLLQGAAVERFLARRGPGVQSMAWEVDDNWAAEHAVRDRGIDVISPNIPSRFFFLQPRHTSGLLIELCDEWMLRHMDEPAVTPGLLGPVGPAWVTGVVADIDATVAWMQDLLAVEEVAGNPTGDERHERTVDLAVGNVTVRLVTPTSVESRYTPALEAGPAWHSVALRVPDLDGALKALEAEGAPAIYREGPLAATDPTGTLGLRLDWTS